MNCLYDYINEIKHAAEVTNKSTVIITVDHEEAVKMIYNYFNNISDVDKPRRIGVRLPRFLKMFETSFLQFIFIYKQKVIIVQNN